MTQPAWHSPIVQFQGIEIQKDLTLSTCRSEARSYHLEVFVIECFGLRHAVDNVTSNGVFDYLNK